MSTGARQNIDEKFKRAQLQESDKSFKESVTESIYDMVFAKET